MTIAVLLLERMGAQVTDASLDEVEHAIRIPVEQLRIVRERLEGERSLRIFEVEPSQNVHQNGPETSPGRGKVLEMGLTTPMVA